MGCVKSTKRIPGRDREYQVDGISNRIFANTNDRFQLACDKAGIKPTKRQASKFRRGYGKAYNVGPL